MKSFWKYIQSLKSNKSNISTTVFLDNVTSDNISDTTKLFENYFSSVYHVDNPNIYLNDYPILNNINLNLNTWHISECETEDILNTLNNKSGVGPDEIPPSFLKSCMIPLTKPLHYLFNLSLSSGVFPDCWKKSFITPNFKSGDKNNCNYRPISKLSVIPKMFEALITKKLVTIISNYISPFQHGFRPKHSILTNLLSYQTQILQSFEKYQQIDAIYTDFQKAFDKVNHVIFFTKIKLIWFQWNVSFMIIILSL